MWAFIAFSFSILNTINQIASGLYFLVGPLLAMAAFAGLAGIFTLLEKEKGARSTFLLSALCICLTFVLFGWCQ